MMKPPLFIQLYIVLYWSLCHSKALAKEFLGLHRHYLVQAERSFTAFRMTECSLNWNLFSQDCFHNLMYQQSISYTLDSNHFRFDAETS